MMPDADLRISDPDPDIDSPAPDAAVAAYLSTKLAEYRRRLLDLSTANPLIAFKHSPTGKTHVRIVDERPDVVFARLEAGRTFTLEPLPEPRTEPEDEAGPAFKAALATFKSEDPIHLEQLESVRRKGGTEADLRQLERRARDRVRHNLGMPAWVPETELSPEDLARKYGIDPAYDCARPGAEEQDRHLDDGLQTLHLPKVLEDRLRRLQEKARTSVRELGLGTLFAAFGFLEWSDGGGTKAAFGCAPLILMPLTIERRLTRNRYRTHVRGVEEPAALNRTLERFLAQRFQLALPAFGEDDTPESWFARLEDLLARVQPRWHVRRYLTIGVFPFSRLALYEDLNIDNWPAPDDFLNHPIIRALLASAGAGDGGTGEPAIDRLALAGTLPALIYDADSSQHAAIIEALSGANVAIHGPPGTGKSQTIANLIGAALDAGRSVLFVAEKQAALDVVADRLDKAGLGHFCLNLHAQDASKAAAIEAFGQRLAMEPPRFDAEGHQRRTAEWRRALASLAAYAEHLNAPVGAAGLTAHDVLWRFLDRSTAETRTFLNGVVLQDAERITGHAAQECRRALADLERRQTGVFDPTTGTTANPWHGVGLTEAAPLERIAALDLVHHWGRAIATLGERCTTLFGSGGANLTLATLERLARLLQVLPALPVGSRVAADPSLAQPADRQSLLLRHRLRRELADLEARIEAVVRSPPAAGAGPAVPAPAQAPEPTPALIRNLRDQVERLGCADLALPALRSHMQSVAAHAEALAAAADQMSAVIERLGLEQEARTEAALLAAAALVARIDRPLLLARSPAVIDERNHPLITGGAQMLDRLRTARRALAARFRIEALPPAGDLRDHARILRNEGWLGFLDGKTRAARQLYRSICLETAPVDKPAMAGALEELANHAEAVAAFERDRPLQDLLGPRFRGLDTDFATLTALIAWVADLNRTFAGLDPLRRRIRELVLEGELPILDELRSLTALLPMLVDPSNDSLAATVRDRHAAVIAHLAAVETLAATLETLFRSPAIRVPIGERLATLAAMIDARCDLMERNAADDGATLPDLDIAYCATLERLGAEAFLTELLVTAGEAPHAAAEAIAATLTDEAEAWSALAMMLKIDQTAFFDGKTRAEVPIDDLRDRAFACAVAQEPLTDWIAYGQALERAGRGPARPVIACLQAKRQPLTGLVAAFDYVFYRTLASIAYRSPVLRTASGETGRTAADFRRADAELISLERHRLAAALFARPIPSGVGQGRPGDFTERALLVHEAGKKRGHRPLRELFLRAGAAARALKPCFMMSPVTVAQFLPRLAQMFDLVIIDEASQVRPEDAFACLVRARRCVVVGDPKQLPPTDFFRGSWLTDDGDGDGDGDSDGGPDRDGPAESVLDLALRVFRPTRSLLWHYRSQNSRLINFSNRHFYDNRLIVFPGAAEGDPSAGVVLVPTPGLSRSGTNPAEAQAVVSAARIFMRDRRDQSLGIVALNSAQSTLLQETFEHEALGDPAVRRYLEKWDTTLTPFFIKNLESVQGDERDVVFISTVVAKEPGRDLLKLQSLGPINRDQGPRRLNVLFTRARRQIRVFTGLVPTDIPLSAREGARILRAYLEYAAGGRIEQETLHGDSVESAFEGFVKTRLELAGYQVVPQVGTAGFRIDLAVRHHDHPGCYLLGIECDGAQYHAARSVRDRDRLRQQVLEGLGWQLYRIWSTDWFADPDREAARLLAALDQRRQELSRTEVQLPAMFDGVEPAMPEPEPVPDADEPAPVQGLLRLGPPTGYRREDDAAEDIAAIVAEPIVAEPIVAEVVPADERDDLALPGRRIGATPSLPPPADEWREPSRMVAVGDWVTYSVADRPHEQRRVRIVRGPDDPAKGIINESKPLAIALLGGALGETVGVSVGQTLRPVAIKIVGLEKGRTEGQDRWTAPPPSEPALRPYPVWRAAKPLPVPTQDNLSAVAATLVEIVRVEGPMTVDRLYRQYCKAAAIQRLGKAIRAALNKALSRLHRERVVVIVQTTDSIGYADADLRLRDQPPVIMREIPPRELEEVPLTELAAHLRRLQDQQPTLPTDDLFRECVRLAGGQRLTADLRTRLSMAARLAWSR